MTKKFNANDRCELVQKISQHLNITLTRTDSAFQKLYTDPEGNTYCIFNGGPWHSIYDSMFKALTLRKNRNIFIIWGALDKYDTVRVYKGKFDANLIPELPEHPEIRKQNYLDFKVSGNEAIMTANWLGHNPPPRLVRMFEYKLSGDFINNDDSDDHDDDTIIRLVPTGKPKSV